jgi:hypothetical protein
MKKYETGKTYSTYTEIISLHICVRNLQWKAVLGDLYGNKGMILEMILKK